MKRIALFLCSLFISLTILAQGNAHLKFMGIPITGTITQFQSKLTQKGCTYDKSTSSVISAGTRAFKGTFVGFKVDIYAYYDTNTKIVYRVKAVISGTSEDLAEQHYNKIKSLLSQKYGTDYMQTDTKEGKESVSFLCLKNLNDEVDLSSQTLFDVANGDIDLYITQDEETWVRAPYNYNVHIDYNDFINTDKHSNQQLDEI